MASSNGRGTLERETVDLTGLDEAAVAGVVDALAGQNEILTERIAELEFDQEDQAWERLDGGSSAVELDRQTLRRIIRRSQVMYLKNPLIDHGAGVVASYVFGQGVKVVGTDATNDRVQAFMDEPSNKRVLLGKQASLKADAQLTYEGQVFIACFGAPNEVTRLRVIPTLEIVDGDIITDPEDAATPWYYQRRWTAKVLDEASGETRQERRTDYYPALGYAPARKPSTIGAGDKAGPVHWDSPVLHVSDGGLNGGRFGVPITFSSLDWARAVTRDLSNYATIKHALARFAWQVTARTRASARTAQARLATTITTEDPQETNPPPVTGATWIGTEGNKLDPIRTAGAQPSPEEGRRLGLMVSAGLGIPETILFGNADVGNLATSKTLDRPTELMMMGRQGIWEEAYQSLIGYDLGRALADGKVARTEPDPANEGQTRPTSTVVTVTFPSILERSVTERVDAIVKAATLGAQGTPAGTMPAELLVRLLLVALDVDDIDEVIEQMFPPEAVAPEIGVPTPPDATTSGPMEATFAEALDAFTARLARHA